MATVILSSIGAQYGGMYASSLMAGTMASATEFMVATSIGRAIGGLAGAYVGGAIDRAIFGTGAEDMQGSRLQDLTYTSSVEGTPIPLLFGTMRMSGTVIWTTGLVETEHEEDSGGGSFGGGGSSYTYYTYSTSCAVALCEGPIVGVRRIWADGKLMYDVGENADLDTLLASNASSSSIRFYLGNETQSPDPTVQAAVGASNAPAFRGTAYVVFVNLQLANYANRIPNFTFEVVGLGSAVQNYRHISVTPFAWYAGWKLQIIEVEDGVVYTRTSADDTKYIMYNMDTGTYLDTLQMNPVTQTGAQPENIQYSFNQKTIGKYGNYRLVYLGNGYSPTGLCLCDPATYTIQYNFTDLVPNPILYSIIPCSDWRHVLIIPTNLGATYLAPTDGLYGHGTYYIIDVIDKVIVSQGDVRVDNTYGIYANYATEHFGCGCLDIDLQTVVIQYQNGVSVQRIVNNVLESPTWLQNDTANFTGFTHGTIFIKDGLVVAAVPVTSSGHQTGYAVFYLQDRLSRNTVTLKSVLDKLSSHSGLSSDDYDFANMATIAVNGYTVSLPGNARNAFDLLSSVYYFDFMEQDGKIKAVIRGGVSTNVIQESEIGARIL